MNTQTSSSQTYTGTATGAWDQVWKKETKILAQEDPMCLLIAHMVQDELIALKMPLQSAIEIGAGSGRTSRYLNDWGARTGVLDISSEALRVASFAFEGAGKPFELIQKDLFEIRPEQFSEPYQVAWNAGVLEHFSPEDQTRILERMADTTTPDGVVIALVPYSRAIFYRLGKWILEVTNRFPYGTEIPFESLVPVAPKQLTLVRPERSVGFVILIFNGFKAISHLPGLETIGLKLQAIMARTMSAILARPIGLKIVKAIDRGLSRVLGGYLLVSTFKRSL
jgi:2-polyprenyl-3-methyl-5-hydroxy-6-metoxy-1,4-benzoquinol methylase